MDSRKSDRYFISSSVNFRAFSTKRIKSAGSSGTPPKKSLNEISRFSQIIFNLSREGIVRPCSISLKYERDIKALLANSVILISFDILKFLIRSPIFTLDQGMRDLTVFR